ncbi:hypothetical protein EV210_10346 [Anaerospora hongkongensis]|uniref:Flagellar Assembly Protein A N-terminal region domain-containing protein n=1 Tax=Anaerospora hongkongensis TaxID=244830 RepID=A0A4R1Q0Y8_9FIRM|nr:FapA family protein [Anaerospora hongkongensis]TCL38574.1 hypothetical protein EV210_10346 [Anaerospora hongkongensis]
MNRTICSPKLTNSCSVAQVAERAVDGRYQITATDTAVFLSVWPPINNGLPVAKAAVIQDLTSRNLLSFDSDFLSTVIKEAAGTPVQIINSLPSEDGRYQITATDVGVFLSVWLPVNSGVPVAKAAVMKELAERNLVEYDSDFLSTVIKEATGTPVLIMNPVPAVQLTSSIRVRVGLSRLEARMDIMVPPEAPLVTRAQLLDKLAAAGVVFGIDEEALTALTETRCAANVIVARAVPARSGENAYLKFYVDPDSQGRPEELEDGRVDFKEINSFLCVEEGQLLVEKIPATAGIEGIDVYGKPLPAKPGKDKPMPVGKNVIVVDDWRLYAAINGHLHIFLDKRINVLPVIVIDGDVDYNTGNIEFKGSVLVRGSIQSGFSVKAGGNVEVCDSICGGTVEAASIVVHKGIQGMNRGIVKARERIVANFIENAAVYADEEIVVSDAVMNSTLFAGSRIIVEGKRGLIRGGRISAGEVILAVTVGNKSGIVTELEVAANPFLKEELLSLREKIKKDELLYDELKLALTYLGSLDIQQLPAAKQEMHKKNETQFKAVIERMESMRQRITNIEMVLGSLKPGRIKASGTIYPGTKMAIGSAVKTLKDTLQFVSLYVQAGEITFGSLR